MSTKKLIKQHQCPECGFEEFITEPNQYDVLKFNSGRFEIEHSEFCDEFKLFCRECGVEINEQMSEKKGQVLLQLINKNT